MQPGKKNYYVVIPEHSKYLVYTLEKSLIILTCSYFPVSAVTLSSEYKGEVFRSLASCCFGFFFSILGLFICKVIRDGFFSNS